MGRALGKGEPWPARDSSQQNRRTQRRGEHKRTEDRKAFISFPESLIENADAVAKYLGLSRSTLIRIALEKFLKGRREETFARSIDRYLAQHGSELSEEDEAWLAHNRRQLRRVEWKE
jgi:hypothetical protein